MLTEETKTQNAEQSLNTLSEGESRENKVRCANRLLAGLASVPVILCGICLVAVLLIHLLLSGGSRAAAAASGVSDAVFMDRFDMFMVNKTSDALDGILNIDKVYWLSDQELVAPKPNPDNYGTARKPEELAWLLEEAQDLIGDQEMLFGMDTPVWDGDKIYYYYDETILVITWKEEVGRATYTFSEVKIAHPSQFRRFLADGEFGSDKQYVTTDMANSVNAVVASSGDFYKHRHYGIVVYDGEIKRSEFQKVDTCFIDDQGDLIFSPQQQFKDQETAQQYVDDHNIRFSLAFGPILVEDGKACVPPIYLLGEIDGHYSRMALCQTGPLHYLLVNSTAEFPTQLRPTIAEFADVLVDHGVEKAYALDGGQTTVITMDGELINSVDYGFQRQISDIIYFATALPDGE